MKITIIIPDFPYPKTGNIRGSRTFAKNLVIYLKKLGMKVKIITTFSTGDKRFDEFNGIPILRVLDSSFLFGRFGRIFHLNDISLGINLLRKKNYEFFIDSDIIILFLAFTFTRMIPIKNIPVISIFFHYDHLKKLKSCITVPFLHLYQKWQFKIHKNIITLSNFSRNQLNRYYALESENIKIISPGVDTNKYTPSNYNKKIREKFGENILLYVGYLTDRKRIPVLLEAMKYVIRDVPKVHLIIIGKGPKLDSYKNLTYNLGIHKHITFLGFVDEASLLQYYASSDIFIFPSELEGFGQVILEAMASGITVICANKPPMSEIVEDGGLSFKLNDSIDLSKKILKMLKDHKLLLKYRENALKISKRYEWLKISKMYVNYLKEKVY